MKALWKRTLVPVTILLCGGVVMAQQVPRNSVNAGKLGFAAPDDTKIQALLTQRLDLLRQMETLYRAQYQSGQASLEDLEQATIAVYQTDLQRKHTQAERKALTQQWVDTAQDIQKIAEARVRIGQATKVEEIKAQATLVEAKIALERETMGDREP